MNKKTLTGLIAAAALTGTFSAMKPANAASFVVTVEAPGVQQSQLLTNKAYGAKNIYEANFDSTKTGTYTQSTIAFAGDSNIGSYQNAYINAADQYGGAKGTGNYFDVDKARSGGITSSTLNLTSSQRYFGLWWSAGDSFNQLDFYSGGTLLQSFSTKDVVDFIAKQPNKSQYYGNPTDKYKGQDNNEPFAFLNFFADPDNTNVKFDKIIFTNSGATGFESDNHTIASAYGNITGTSIVAKTPESSSVLGIFATGVVGVSSTIARSKNKKSGAVVG